MHREHEDASTYYDVRGDRNFSCGKLFHMFEVSCHSWHSHRLKQTEVNQIGATGLVLPQRPTFGDFE